MKELIMNNGIHIPCIGYGVFRMTDLDACEKAVLQALKTGYRFIDTAAAYENEEAVGRAIKRSGIKREELFISTKLWVSDTSYEKAKAGFYRSLERLGLDYVDLYLIHQPYHDYYGAYKALVELYQEGKIKALGVDNFKQDRLADFLFFNDTKPAVNMIECNPFYQRDDEKEYLEKNNMQMLAWSPLAAGKASVFENEILKEIASHHQKSVAQIVLRWFYQRQIIPIVKSANPKRMKENIEIFDFELSNEEMKLIGNLDTGHTCFHERDTAQKVNHFLEQSLKFKV